MTGDPREVLSRPAPAPDLTLRYGEHPDQIADLRFPPPDQVGPARGLVVVVHGGFWRAEYDRQHISPLAADLAARGYLVAQLEYRRTGQPGGGWPGTFHDVASGLAALPGLIAEAVTAESRVDVTAPAGPPILLGHSAGGHLALWYAGHRPGAARGVVALAPVANLAEGYERNLDDGAVAELLGGDPQLVPERYDRADPSRQLPLTTPTVVIHGARDQQVPIEMSRRYVAAAQAAGSAMRLVELPDIEHFGLIDPISPAWPQVLAGLHSLS